MNTTFLKSNAARLVGASLALAGVVFAGAVATAPAADAAPTKANSAYTVALIGDMPYDDLGALQAPNVINAINKSKVELALFDGDTMSGKGNKCTDEAYPALKTNFFDKFTKPVFYSVGDNEWVDCDRAVKGAYDPATRLALVRSNFFGSAGSYINLGKANKAIVVEHDANYPEMTMFTYRKVTYVIPHVPGSANNAAVTAPYKTYNDTTVDGNDAEFKARDAANVAWINKGFAEATAKNSLGVIVVVQANMDWEGYLAAADKEYTAAYDNTKQALLTNTIAFKKPVLLQNGDEHWYQLDMPMNETAGKLVQRDKGALVTNFTRVQTFGSGFNHWVELTIDPKNPLLFSFTPKLIAANIAAH